MKKPIYLVPCDFTPIFKNALRLGIDLAEYNKGTVIILHLIAKKSEKMEAEQKMKKIMADLSEAEKEIVESRVILGEIYEDVARAGEVLDASVIVMSTHGAKGLQKIRGSHALRMVDSSSIPFMITQGTKKVDKMKNIVMPFCYEKDSLQIAQSVAKIAKQFNSTIHLVGYLDKSIQSQAKTKSHQKILHKFFSEQGIQIELHNINYSDGYEKSLFKYAKEVDADLFAATFFNTTIITGINNFLQSLLENEDDIPVFTINAEELGTSSVTSVMM